MSENKNDTGITVEKDISVPEDNNAESHPGTIKMLKVFAFIATICHLFNGFRFLFGTFSSVTEEGKEEILKVAPFANTWNTILFFIFLLIAFILCTALAMMSENRKVGVLLFIGALTASLIICIISVNIFSSIVPQLHFSEGHALLVVNANIIIHSLFIGFILLISLIAVLIAKDYIFKSELPKKEESKI